MAHELDFTTGEAGIAIRYDGKTPWHQYGARVDDDATLNDWRIAAGLNWEVDERAVYYSRQVPEIVGGDDFALKNVPTPIKNRKVLVRSDNQEPLSIVGKGYHVVQPEKVMDFYRELIAENGFKMDTAGSLMDGRRIWALASIGESTKIFGRDQVDGYVLLATSYDGSMATTCQFTSVRVVCNNTLEWATEAGKGAFKVAHNKEFDPQEAKGSLGLTKESWELYEQNVNKMANTQIDLETAMAFFITVLGKDGVTYDENGAPTYSTTLTKMFAAYEKGPGSEMRSAHHTAWGLVNAVTFYQDHMAKSNLSGSRLNSAWFGTGNNRKNKAFEEAMKIAA